MDSAIMRSLTVVKVLIHSLRLTGRFAESANAHKDHGPIAYSGGAVVVWTVSAALITTGVFIGAYQLAQSSVSMQYNGGMAFLVTVIVQYGITAVFHVCPTDFENRTRRQMNDLCLEFPIRVCPWHLILSLTTNY